MPELTILPLCSTRFETSYIKVFPVAITCCHSNSALPISTFSSVVDYEREEEILCVHGSYTLLHTLTIVPLAKFIAKAPRHSVDSDEKIMREL